MWQASRLFSCFKVTASRKDSPEREITAWGFLLHESTFMFSFCLHSQVYYKDLYMSARTECLKIQRANMLAQGSVICNIPLTSARTQPARSPHVEPRQGFMPRTVSKCGRLTGGSSLVSNGSERANKTQSTQRIYEVLGCESLIRGVVQADNHPRGLLRFITFEAFSGSHQVI